MGGLEGGSTRKTLWRDESDKLDAIVGIERNSRTLTEMVAREIGLRVLVVRNTDSSGKEWHLDTNLRIKNVLIIDDVVSTGGTLEAVVNSLRSVGMNVNQIITFADFKGLSSVLDVPLSSVFNAKGT